MRTITVAVLTVALTLGGCGERPLVSSVAALGSMRYILASSNEYKRMFGSYAPDLKSMGGTYAPNGSGEVSCNPSKQAACLMDQVTASGRKNAYAFTYTAGDPDAKGIIKTFTLYAESITDGTKDITYFADQTGIIRREDGKGKRASASSPAVTS